MAAEIHVGDVGTSFRATFRDEADAVIDISAATELKMWFEKPAATEGEDPETVEFDATLVADGADGVAEYVTDEGDLDRPGNWRVQGVVTLGAAKVHSNITKFKVFANLRADS